MPKTDEEQVLSEIPAHPLFTYTVDLVGVLPTKPLLCPRCKAIDQRDEVMLFRLSQLGQSPELNNWVIDVQLKCPHCSMVVWHGLPTTEKHFKMVHQLRAAMGVKLAMRYVPQDEWKKSEHKEVIRRLEALGYF